jgi:hypothetical protein
MRLTLRRRWQVRIITVLNVVAFFSGLPSGFEPQMAVTIAQVTVIPGVSPQERPTINRQAEPFPLPSANLPQRSNKEPNDAADRNSTGSSSPGRSGTGERHSEVIPSKPER